jgi:repressor LexA
VARAVGLLDLRARIRYYSRCSYVLEYWNLNRGSDTMTSNAQPPGGDDGNHILTERQRKVLDCVHQSLESRGYPPTLREIASAVGLKAISTAAHHVKTLERRGYLSHDAGMPRTVVESSSRLRVIQHRPDEVSSGPMIAGSQNLVSLPLFERIAAGNPVIANPYSEGFMYLPREMVGSGELFAVRVTGDSMVNASIFDGDYVVVRRHSGRRLPPNGEGGSHHALGLKSEPPRAFPARVCITAARVPRITVHGTRKTCASLLAALDVHPRVAMRILRHSKIGITMEVYTEFRRRPLVMRSASSATG